VKELAGKTAFVTGAASGVGLGIAEALAQEGVNLVLADIDAAGLSQASETLGQAGVRVTALPVDVADATAMEETARRVAALGPLHVLVNNAGVAVPTAPISSLSLDDWHWLMGVNVFGVIHGLRFLLPLIRAHGQDGHVVNTASIAGLQVRPGRGTQRHRRLGSLPGGGRHRHLRILGAAAGPLRRPASFATGQPRQGGAARRRPAAAHCRPACGRGDQGR
jgi:NAD(P)-dependent dehydrogenase (short-subunit alcohol dehydrogenase family)